MDKYQNIALALAGMMQAASLVNELALYGDCNEDSLQNSLATIYKIDSDSVADIFCGPAGVKLGLLELDKILTKHKGHVKSDVIRYLVGLMSLESLLRKDKKAQHTLRKDVEQITHQVDYFSGTTPTVIANLARIYEDTISPLKKRIIVTGKEAYVRQDDILQKIRALLLAGVRASVAWKQVGGNRLQLFFSRQKLARAIANLLSES